MIAMQYSFVLPADYDMAIVRERIAVKGKLLDDLPGLTFKAYLYAQRAESETDTETEAEAEENLYAPFYLWHDADAMHDFLNGPGFAGVARAFGWPSVRTWTPWHTSVGDEVRQARHASRSVAAIAPYSDLADLRLREQEWARQTRRRGALAVVIGFEPAGWSIVRLSLWREAPADMASPGELHYRVGHMSAPAGITGSF